MKNYIDSIRTFSEPESIAVICATKKPGFSYGQTKALLNQGFGDRLYFVNPNENELYGKKVYKNVLDIPSHVDLALIIVPARLCPEIISQCAKKGIRRVIVLSAGFSETGDEGKRIEEEIPSIAKDKGMRIIGPSCKGLLGIIRIWKDRK
jgi:acetyltransferase